MLKIGLHGSAGRMGTSIQRCISHFTQKCQTSYCYDINIAKSSLEKLCLASDVIIDFSHPKGTKLLIESALKFKTKLLIGTTGFSKEDLEIFAEYAKIIPILYTENTSIGVSILRRIIPQIAKMLNADFDLSISETHHSAKKDKPSGTSLALSNLFSENNHILNDKIQINSFRSGDIPGEHTINIVKGTESLSLTHRVYDRSIFAMKAIEAAIWLHNKEAGKLYNMLDTLTD